MRFSALVDRRAALFRDSKPGEIHEGTNEIQRWVIARHLFGRDIVG